MIYLKSNPIFHILIYIITIQFISISSLFALSKDLKINISIITNLDIDYVLAKGICRTLKREIEVSKFKGGTNTLDCKVNMNNDVIQNLKLVKLGNNNFFIIDPSQIPKNYNLNLLSSVAFFPSVDRNWILLGSIELDNETVCEIVEALYINIMELSYLHRRFNSFNHRDLMNKLGAIPIHMGSFKFFENKNCKFNKLIIKDL